MEEGSLNIKEEETKHEHKKEESKSDTIKLSKSTLWKASTGVLAVLFVISLFTGGFGIGNGEVKVVNQPSAPSPGLPTTAGVVQVSVDDDPVKGDKNAPVTIIEFSDFQCPFCGRFYAETLGQIEEKYIKTGKVRFVYRDFPLTSIHPMAQKAAEAAECADEQEKFWEYHNTIFDNQQSLSLDNLKLWAANLGLDTNKFNDCLESNKYADEVNKDANDAVAAGGQGTPFFVINGRPLSGAQPFAAFQAAIESSLA